MAQSILQKLDKFHSDPKLQVEFEEIARRAWLPDLLWPDRRPKIFPAKFRGPAPKAGGRKRGGGRREVVYPLLDVSRRLDYAAIKLAHLSRTMESHPAVAFLYLTLFQEEFRPPEKRRARSTAAGTAGSGASAKAATDAEHKKLIYNKIQRLKRRLVVSPAVKRARNRHDLSVAVLADLAAAMACAAVRAARCISPISKRACSAPTASSAADRRRLSALR